MVESDILVGSVAIALGSVVTLASVFNWQWYYELQKARWVESHCGRNGARVVFVVLGLLLIALGGAISTGVLSHQARTTLHPRKRPYDNWMERASFVIESAGT